MQNRWTELFKELVQALVDEYLESVTFDFDSLRFADRHALGHGPALLTVRQPPEHALRWLQMWVVRAKGTLCPTDVRSYCTRVPQVQKV